MKKILSALLLLPLMAAAFIACSSDDDITTGTEQPVNKTVSFTVSLDPQTRLAYSDEKYDDNNKDRYKLKTHWDSYDLNETVILKSSSDNEEYRFTISEIGTDGLTATFTYDGENGDFPDPFYGTATYEIDAVEQKQAANGSLDANVPDATAHLNYGSKLVATIGSEGLSVSKGGTVEFSHVGTSFFRVAIKAPEGGITSGAELVVKVIGLSTEENGQQIEKVKFNFNVDENATIVAYMRCTTQTDATKLVYTIIQGDDTYSYDAKFNTSHSLEGGKYYYTDLTNKTATHNPKYVYDNLGGAPADVQPIDLDIKMGEDDEYEYKLLLGDRYLGASEPFWAVSKADGFVEIETKLECTKSMTTRQGTHQNDTGLDCLYFYWGEVEGHRTENYKLK